MHLYLHILRNTALKKESKTLSYIFKTSNSNVNEPDIGNLQFKHLSIEITQKDERQPNNHHTSHTIRITTQMNKANVKKVIKHLSFNRSGT